MNSISNDYSNNLNFTAKMDVRKVVLNKARWQRIANLFEEKTQNYPNDSLEVTELPCAISLYGINSKTGVDYSADFIGVLMDKMMNMSDGQIVSKFKKILSISNKKGRLFEKTQKFIDSISNKKGSELDEYKIWDAVIDKGAQDAKNAIKKDSFLKDADILM